VQNGDAVQYILRESPYVPDSVHSCSVMRICLICGTWDPVWVANHAYVENSSELRPSVGASSV
jgi:hypothetical protein